MPVSPPATLQLYACKSDKSASIFQPTDDTFEQHIIRVNYQVAIWIHSHEENPDLWNPDGNGWRERNNRLEPVMFERDAAPKEVRDLTDTSHISIASTKTVHKLEPLSA